MNSKKLFVIIRTLRPGQWVKNLAVFASIIFTGQLFIPEIFTKALFVFASLCLLSSASYTLNDIIDAPYDRKHPLKKDRPIAKGDLAISQAVKIVFLFVFAGLILAAFQGLAVFLICLFFIILHVFYSFLMKKFAPWDILGISLSFIVRALAGEIATGYHLPIWLMFTVVFLSLFIASGKRRSELVSEGSVTRPTLDRYQKSLLNFYSSIFAVATLISYSLFTYFSEMDLGMRLARYLETDVSHMVFDRKWLMITILPVIFGIMRYAQLVYSYAEGQRPEKLLTSDIPLAFSIVSWGLILIFVIYVI
jgi:decaprenyl-phosphate phosphoribosyltransferase